MTCSSNDAPDEVGHFGSAGAIVDRSRPAARSAAGSSPTDLID
jgi:hypothetical protein